MPSTVNRIHRRMKRLRHVRADRSARKSFSRNSIVEVFERREIAGWVDAEPGSGPLSVELCVNEVPVAKTWAAPANGRHVHGELLRFRFRLTDLWNFTKRADRVSIRVDSQPIPIINKGMYYHPRRDGSQSLRSLRKRLESGYVFGQSGRLQLKKGLDTEWQTAVLGLYQRLNAVLETEFDVRAFVCYGSLLGAVRDKGFIGHDLDFDSAYISKSRTGEGAAESLAEISMALMDHGYSVVPKYSCIAVKDDPSDEFHVDIFHLYLDESGQLNFPFGIAGEPSRSDKGFEDLQTFDLAGHEVLLPGNAERMVELIYGANWRTPNPGFKWQNDRTVRARPGIVTIEQIDEVARANIAPSQEDRTGPMRAALSSNPHLPDVVVEIGSSLGHDSVELARAGKRVFGLERTAMSVERAEGRVKSADVTDNVEFRIVEINDPERLTKAVDEVRQLAGDGNITFYARSFLKFSDRALRSALESLETCGKPGDYLVADFRDAPAERWPKDKGANPTPRWTRTDFLEELERRPMWSVESPGTVTADEGDDSGGPTGVVLARRG